MKTIPRLLHVTFILFAMVSAQDALAGDCSTGRCPFAAAAPPVPPAAATTASTSRGFTATGGTRVADVNLSQEALEVINSAGKEEPLPKGCTTAAERAKLAARQLPQEGWNPNEIPWGSLRARSHSSVATRVAQNSLLKPREAKPFTRRSAAGPVKPRKSFAHVVEL